ncbi:unnamed protein product [Phytophthora fragariaefolia]|uniref:Unnamed protein product n=1 Tax=Phytophthora fragariaefolia TaxID=1490495 RepID=A0A9W6U5S7_9STRA|nr:unnamed protein product [Phytophthora fragariaefolia]
MGICCAKAPPKTCQLPYEKEKRTNAFVKMYHESLKSWHRNQIGHRSQYSVERLLAFQDYHHRSSITGVVAVCVITPIPATIIALLIDSIPLRSPSDGWKANYTVWIRLLLDAFAVALGLIVQVKEVVVTGIISNGRAFAIAFGTAISYVSLPILVAASWRFPIPFGAVISVIPMVVFLCSYTVLTVGPRMLSSPVLRKQVKSQLKIVAAQGFVAATKHMIANGAEGLREYVGLVVVFSVDLFNVFYVAICMQTAKSTITTLLMIASDSCYVLLALRAIFHKSNVVKANEEVSSLGNSDDRILPSEINYFRDLPGMIRSIFGDTEISHARSQQIRVFAPFPLPLSNESVAFISEITRTKRDSHVYSSSRVLISGHLQLEAATRAQSVGRVHVKRDLGAGSSSNRTLAFNPDATLSSKALRATLVQNSTEEVVWDALQTLFHSEYLLMAEYIACALPLLYTAYLVILFHLPSAQFYPSAASSPQKLATNISSIAMFAAVEYAGFVGLLVLLKRKFGVSPLYQLAFVLETQARTLQGHLLVWTIFILHMPLTHYGVNFNLAGAHGPDPVCGTPEQEVRTAVGPYHIAIGLSVIGLVVATVEAGILEKLAFNGSCNVNGELNGENVKGFMAWDCVIGNGIGLLVALSLVVLVVTIWLSTTQRVIKTTGDEATPLLHGSSGDEKKELNV